MQCRHCLLSVFCFVFIFVLFYDHLLSTLFVFDVFLWGIGILLLSCFFLCAFYSFFFQSLYINIFVFSFFLVSFFFSSFVSFYNIVCLLFNVTHCVSIICLILGVKKRGHYVCVRLEIFLIRINFVVLIMVFMDYFCCHFVKIPFTSNKKSICGFLRNIQLCHLRLF